MNFGTLKAKNDVTSTHTHAIEGAYAWMNIYTASIFHAKSPRDTLVYALIGITMLLNGLPTPMRTNGTDVARATQFGGVCLFL